MQANPKIEVPEVLTAIRRMTVVSVGERGRLVVSAEGAAPREASIAVVGEYAARAGDTVLVAESAGALYVIGVLVALREVRAEAGVSVSGEPGAEVFGVRDASGRLIFEHHAATGKSVLHAAGDVEIAAPAGSVRIAARDGVAIESEKGRASIRVGEEIALAAASIRAVAAHTELATGTARVVAKSLETAAETVKTLATVLETRAERIFERARDTYRESEELSQTRAGRVRMLVGETIHLLSRRLVAQAEDDVKIDGKQILLG